MLGPRADRRRSRTGPPPGRLTGLSADAIISASAPSSRRARMFALRGSLASPDQEDGIVLPLVLPRVAVEVPELESPRPKVADAAPRAPGQRRAL